MNLCILLQPEHEPIPDNVTVLQDYGELGVHTDNGFITGKQIIMEGEPTAFQDWLRPFDGVWVGRGSPMMQEFAIMHIK